METHRADIRARMRLVSEAFPSLFSALPRIDPETRVKITSSLDTLIRHGTTEQVEEAIRLFARCESQEQMHVAAVILNYVARSALHTHEENSFTSVRIGIAVSREVLNLRTPHSLEAVLNFAFHNAPTKSMGSRIRTLAKEDAIYLRNEKIKMKSDLRREGEAPAE